MKIITNILISAAAALLAGLALPSCIYDDGYDTHELSDNIHINTGTLDNATAIAADPNNTFRLLFWMEGDENTGHLATPSGKAWPRPYLSKGAPQAVQFYTDAVFDTDYPYPYPDTSPLYAIGFAPDGMLRHDETNNDTDPANTENTDATTFSYRKLRAKSTDGAELSRVDFLACDYWPEVYRGSKLDPFAQPKNKLYFRHLAAKLVFIAIRDPRMENRQHVRDIEIKNLRMSTDGSNWGPMWTPCAFEWQTLSEDDFSDTYNALISGIAQIPGNESVTKDGVIVKPRTGYKATDALPFAGNPSDYVLKRKDSDRVPIDGQRIDSCYVCNPFPGNTPSTAARLGGGIRLKMDISAEMSYDPGYAKPDQSETAPDGSTTTTGSTTDNLTFDKEWLGQVVNEIKEVTIGPDGMPQVNDNIVTSFKPGREYRIYLRFHRTGVSLVAREMPWNYGGIHYITFQPGTSTTPAKPSETEQ